VPECTHPLMPEPTLPGYTLPGTPPYRDGGVVPALSNRVSAIPKLLDFCLILVFCLELVSPFYPLSLHVRRGEMCPVVSRSVLVRLVRLSE